MQVNLAGTKLSVTKHMLHEPRRIGKIEILVKFSDSLGLSEKDQQIFEKIGNNCPVMKSLHPDLEVQVTYDWGSNS